MAHPPNARPPHPGPPSRNAILQTLNQAQRRAVSSDAATVAILAGPGSGKTHTLTSRVVYLVDSVGYRPQDVVVATFTVKAAREMRERIGKALGADTEKRIVLGTFHSIARRYLAAYGRQIGLEQKFAIADDSDSRAVITRICKRLQLPLDPPMARAWISKKKSKGTNPDPSGAKPAGGQKPSNLQDLETCYNEYQRYLERSNLLDYDDLLVRCVELLRKFPSCVSNVQAVLIDEYQDTNGVQYELMKLFAQTRQRITIVGDPDQSIYGWRSAEIRNLWRLLRDFPQTDEVALEENYRSSQFILDMSLTVIQQDTKRYNKALRPVHNKGTRPVLRKLNDAATEAGWIISEIRRILMMSGEMVTYGDVAILLRSASLSRHVEHALGKAGIAYKMIGGFKFYERAEIKTLLDYLRVIHQPENNDALARIMNAPKRGVGDVTVKALLAEAESVPLSLWSLLDKHCRGDRQAKTRITKQTEQRISGDLLRIIKTFRKRIDGSESSNPLGLVPMIEQLLTQLKFQKYIEETHAQDHEQRWANVQEFLGLAGDFVRDFGQTEEDTLPEIEGLPQSHDQNILSKFLANVSLASDVQTEDKGQQAAQTVTISTIHAAKGLEWPVVFVPATYNGSIPHARAEDSDEERRLLYVAMTRAQSLLYLSRPLFSSQGRGEKQELSPFLSPIAGSFAKKGPCLDRPVMEGIATILRRTLPSNDAIFKSIPSMSAVEDNLYPEDPENVDKTEKGGRGLGGREGHSGGLPRAKRPRLYGPSGPTNGPDEQPWKKEYATTMEQASNFTVSSLPGFVTAGAHQVALTAADKKSAAQKALQKSAAKRPVDQKSIMGFVKTPSAAREALGGPAAIVPAKNNPNLINSHKRAALAVSTTAEQRPSGAAIAPELASHRIGSSGVMRPAKVRRDDDDGPRKQYACFSSSPTRPSPGDGTRADNSAAPTRNSNNDENNTPVEPVRSAACFHTTTCNMPKGLGGGLRRPAGLGREGIAPADKLRKPFKPLTINRP